VSFRKNKSCFFLSGAALPLPCGSGHACFSPTVPFVNCPLFFLSSFPPDNLRSPQLFFFLAKGCFSFFFFFFPSTTTSLSLTRSISCDFASFSPCPPPATTALCRRYGHFPFTLMLPFLLLPTPSFVWPSLKVRGCRFSRPIFFDYLFLFCGFPHFVIGLRDWVAFWARPGPLLSQVAPFFFFVGPVLFLPGPLHKTPLLPFIEALSFCTCFPCFRAFLCWFA